MIVTVAQIISLSLFFFFNLVVFKPIHHLETSVYQNVVSKLLNLFEFH